MGESMEEAMRESEEFDKKCGEILRLGLGVEDSLEFFISNYFIKPQIDKTWFFRDEILINMGFDKKVQLFRKICHREKSDKEEIKKLLESINYVKKFRNRVAHWGAEKEFDSPIKLRRKAQRTTNKDVCELDEKSMGEFKKQRLTSIEGITKYHLECSRNGTIDEKPVNFDDVEII